VKNGAAGDGSEGAIAGEALVKDGEAVLTGVGTGVGLVETEGLLIVGCGPVYIWPSSPGVNARVEQ
jgi:hypothetical protein